MPRSYNHLIRIGVLSKEKLEITVNDESVTDLNIDMTKISILTNTLKSRPKELEEAVNSIMLIHDSGVIIKIISFPDQKFLINEKDEKDITEVYKILKGYM